MNEFEQKILNYYSLSSEDYFEITKEIKDIKLIDPNSILGMDKVKERIFKAIKNKEKIIIYGDYDCDGITSTSIMMKTFEKLNYPVSYYIPSRYLDGYGLNVENVIKIANKGFNLIIAVDNGISQHDAISKANELGLEVIVIDHHEVPDKQVDAVAIIHPTVSKISNIIGSAGYMSLFVSAALLSHYDEYLVTLAGLSVVSDMMELKGYNRDVVRLAIEYLKKNKYKRLLDLCDNEIIDEKTFGLDIAPKLNAIARMVTDKNINLLVKYLISDNQEDLYKLHDWIRKNNELRKELTKQASDNLPDFSSKPGIAIILDIKEGLIGLIANKLLNTYNVPTIVFTNDEKDKNILKGSIRSKEGFNVVKAYESLNKFLLTGGGHALAGGLSIKKDDFDKFKKEFEELCLAHPVIESEKPSIDISLQDINMENYQILKKFSPFGVGFNEPLFKISDLPTRALTFISNGKHLSTLLSIQTKLLGFNMKESDIKAKPYIDLYGNFYFSSNKYGTNLEFRIANYVSKER